MFWSKSCAFDCSLQWYGINLILKKLQISLELKTFEIALITDLIVMDLFRNKLSSIGSAITPMDLIGPELINGI